MLNVRDFETFQHAHDALPTTGGTLLVPADTYTWDSPSSGKFQGLQIDRPINIIGEENFSEIIPDSAEFLDENAIQIGINSGCTIRNLVIRYAENMNPGSGRAIQWYKPGNEARMAGLHLENVIVDNSPNLAFEFTCDDNGNTNFVSKLTMIGCLASRAKSGGSLFLGGAGANNNTIERCEFNGPGFGRFFNIAGCEVTTLSSVVGAPDVGEVEVGDEVRGLGVKWGTTVASVDGPDQITLSRAAIMTLESTTLTFYRAQDSDPSHLPRGHVHLMRTSNTRLHLCSFQGPGDSPAISTDLVSN